MSTQTDHLSDVNKKHREKMLLLMKNKAQAMFNRPSHFSTNSQKPLPLPTLPQKMNPQLYDFVKQYQSNRTSQPDHESSSFDRADKSLDYNSTLFKFFKQQSNIAQKPSQFMNNGSGVSSQSGITQNLQSNQLLRDDGLLSKIDQLLMNRKKNTNKSGIKNVYDEYLDKKSMSNSSGLSNTSSINSHEFRLTESKLKSNTHTALNKLKTIQEQEKATLTINRQQQEKLKKKNEANKKQPANVNFKRPPLAQTSLGSSTAIQRQKKKIQQTIQQIKKQQNYEFQEKDTLILEFSDNQSSIEEAQIKQQAKTNDDKTQKEKQKQKQSRKVGLNEQKLKLLQELEQIEKQLSKLQKQEQEQEQF